jgi:hypothetical protein
MGVHEVQLRLRNDDFSCNGWATGDSLKVEVIPNQEASWTTVLDGCIGPIKYGPNNGRPVVDITLRSWSVLLDLVSLPTELRYENAALTTIADSIITAALGAGFARSITSDAAAITNFVAPQGMKLREALDLARRALNAGADKWEHGITKVAGVKTYQLYKRSSTVVKTVKNDDLLDGSEQEKGDIAEVVNSAVIVGAQVPTNILDIRSPAGAYYATIRPGATTDRIAQPFAALDSPLSSATFMASKSIAAQPPNIQLGVARDSNNIDLLTHGMAEGLPTRLRIEAGSPLTGILGANDLDATPSSVTDSVNIGAGVTQDILRLNLTGRGSTGFGGAAFVLKGSWGSNIVWRIKKSSDGISYGSAIAADYVTGTTNRIWLQSLDNYVILEAQNTGGTTQTVQVQQFDAGMWPNAATAVTQPYLASDYDDATGPSTTVTGAVAVAIYDNPALHPRYASQSLAQGQPIWPIKMSVRHQVTVADANLNLVVQYTTDGGVSWHDLAILPSSTSAVTDTFFPIPLEVRGLRILVYDQRASGSSSSNVTLYNFRVWVQNPGFNAFNEAEPQVQPFPTDLLQGSTATLDGGALTEQSGTLKETTYDAPNLAIVSDLYYWLVLQLLAGATTSSYWDIMVSHYLSQSGVLSYGSFWSCDDASGTTVNDALRSKNLTWTQGTPANVVWGKGKIGRCLWFYGAGPTATIETDFPHSATDTPNYFGGSYTIGGTVVAGGPSIAATVYIPAGCTGIIPIAGKRGVWSLSLEESSGNYKLVFRTKNGGGTVTTLTGTETLAKGAWHTVLADYLPGGPIMRLQTASSTSSTAATGTLASNTNPMLLGAFRDLSTDAQVTPPLFTIGIDEVYFDPTDGIYTDYAAIAARADSDHRAMASKDSGATWYGLPAGMRVRAYLTFNNHQLVGTASDSASQTAYASLVPGGVLYSSISDDALRTQELVDKEAAALVNRRKSPPRRVRLVVPYDSAIVIGSRITLEVEAAQTLGLGNAALNLDVVDLSYAFGVSATMSLACDEYPIDGDLSADSTVAYATRRTV